MCGPFIRLKENVLIITVTFLWNLTVCTLIDGCHHSLESCYLYVQGRRWGQQFPLKQCLFIVLD